VIVKRAVNLCLCSVVIDVQMTVELARGIFACVVMICRKREEPAAFLFHTRGLFARPPWSEQATWRKTRLLADNLCVANQ